MKGDRHEEGCAATPGGIRSKPPRSHCCLGSAEGRAAGPEALPAVPGAVPEGSKEYGGQEALRRGHEAIPGGQAGGGGQNDTGGAGEVQVVTPVPRLRGGGFVYPPPGEPSASQFSL